MKTVTVSPKYQVVIPRDLRRQLNIQVGQKLRVRVQGDHIEFMPALPLTAARGFLPYLDTCVVREADRQDADFNGHKSVKFKSKPA